jgi:hypothetical protein
MDEVRKPINSVCYRQNPIKFNKHKYLHVRFEVFTACEMSVHTRSAQRYIPEDGILQVFTCLYEGESKSLCPYFFEP